MLAAYGFFFGIYRDRIDDSAYGGEGDDTVHAVEARIAEAESARSVAVLLGIVPLIVWLMFLVPVVEEFEAAIDVRFSFDHYSALDVVFVALATFWLAIALIQFNQARKIRVQVKDLKVKQGKLEALGC